MSAFKEMLERDVKNVFLNTDFFAELRHISYNGADYDIPIILDRAQQKDRNILRDDHAQGIYRVTATMFAAYSDMGCIPKKAQRIWIDGEEFYILTSECEMGQIALGLGAYDE